ncbi:hormogonium polysaccharide biosynthesis protein HpsA [Anabaena sp. UHCC 0451]|uniref:hormogonium polysaccharide biosynthesis protein HpsA n=1 Tax=Anabaena sp. UHCC 0451 TaxID=2055235 RepID=UPI002B201BA5|nr:hormogonium polysaccharide biosynthesis protein HpsA [Anabaena sp. UHCC 0451]MEA5575420.1 hormogonium polysaccharide biosynthesis protein HpsA [Anabaena sp. UHCC 0451]
MSKKYQPLKAKTRISKQIILKFSRAVKKAITWLIKAIFLNKKPRKSTNAGFVLPTVAMVSVVVVLLTLAIMFRSFERSKHASNVRVNQTVINAAIPAIDRARAKINKLFQDKRIPRALPSDQELDKNLVDNIHEYTFGDESTLTLDFQSNEPLKTAWRFPIDTDNNGKFDSYTLYGIYFKNPPKINDKYTRSRTPLEARSIPMNPSNLSTKCQDIFGKNTELVDINGWFKMGSKMKKALFVYTATVPITSKNNITSGGADNYEVYQGNKGFSALEYQQDRAQIPPNNHAIIYEDDLEITPDADFKINGRIFTNSNLLTGANSGSVRLYQISSPNSCFYEPENSQIIVGGELGAGRFTDTADLGTATTVDLFKDKATNPENISGYNPDVKSNKSVTNAPSSLAYNNLAYAKRINQLVNAQFANSLTTDPQEVEDGINQQKQKTGYTPAQYDNIRRHQLEIYFKRRTRRVPFAEVAFGDEQTDVNGNSNPLQDSGDTLRPIDRWVYPYGSDGITGSGNSKLSLNISGSSLKPHATEPIDKLQKELASVEQYLGDRTLVGNNLPEMWWDNEKKQFLSANLDDTQNIAGINWDLSNEPTPRTRRTSVQILADLAATERDGDWEYAAAQTPENTEQENLVGGLRVVTGAGIYLPRNDAANSTDFTNASTQIWSDMLPVPQAPTQTKINPYLMYDSSLTFYLSEMLGSDITTPYLKMRATVVYHYKSVGYNQNNPKPIACISSFYIPSNSTTAKNISTLPDAVGIEKDINGLSNNGIVYPPPSKSASSYANLLNYQASLQYPNGRWVNEPLRNALGKTNLTLSEKSAIDTALCALQIMDGSISPVTTTPPIPHGAIKEIAFLDSRQVKTNQTSSPDSDLSYDLPLQDRQPLEIRATVIDLNQLRTTAIGSEYLLPNSGIIYATRDDALADASAGSSEAAKLESPVDFKLDATRRPNGIVIASNDGSETKLFRGTNNTYKPGEKGLIFASNLPVYIKGDFNKHTQEEFTTRLTSDWSNFYTRNNINSNFACRPGDPQRPNCNSGDEWRNAVVLADSITLLSDNFRFGFRDEGDYDWNNNNGDSNSLNNRPINFKYNAYAPTVIANYDSNGIPNVDLNPNINGIQGSSYFHNFVTPIVKQIQAREYVFEVCSVSDIDVCNSDPKKWVITNVPYNAYDGQGQNNWRNGGGNIEGLSMSAIKTGSLGNANKPSNGWDDANLPKRIAFERDISTGELITPLAVYGVDNSNKIAAFPVAGTTLPRLAKDKNSQPFLIPWLVPDENGTWQPVLQIKQPFATPSDPTNTEKITGDAHNYWLQIATETTFNLIVATGDTPGRSTEDNGGLDNLVRFLENWNPSGNAIANNMTGAFMQMKKSAYSTGTYSTALNIQSSDFQYKINLNNGMSSGYLPPTKQWRYDVGLLSQSPDLFSQKLVTISSKLPNEYFREIGRDDDWIETLLCAKTTETGTYAIDENQRPSCS